MTSKKTLLTLGVVCLLSILVIVIMYWQSLPDSEIKNGFNRKIQPLTLKIQTHIKLGSANYYFAGWIGEKLYLRNVDIPHTLIEVQENFALDTIHLNNPLTNEIITAEVHIDSPFFYVGDLNNYQIYRGHIDNWLVRERIGGPGFFSEYLPVNDSTIAYRTLTSSNKEYRLITESKHHIVDGTGLIQTQIDGLFCTDGMLRFDKTSQSIIYTYFYRNEFIRATSSLQLLERYHTIDTISRARISVANNTEEMYASLSSPPKIVNRATQCVAGQLLVNSNLIADNESRDTFNASDVIDVYSIRDGTYLFSFYVPRDGERRFTHFELHENQLFVLRGSTLEIYEPFASLLRHFNSEDPR